MKKSLSVLMLGMLLVQQLPLRVAFAKSEPAPTETATLSETSATLETPENILSETSATPKTPENIASEGSATPKTPIQPSAEDSALTEEPAPMMRSLTPMMRSPAPMMRSPASMTEFKEIRYFDKTNPADGIIMMDRNLGATSDDFTSPDSYGYYYQRGNNYGFWNGTANATNEDGTQEFLTSDTQVDTSAYGLNNPYRSNIFIFNRNGDRSTSTNANLRGGDHNSPCPVGYHIPTSGEWDRLIDLYERNNGGNLSIGGLRQTFKLPFAGYRDSGDASADDHGNVGYYWSSSPKGVEARGFGFDSSVLERDYIERAFAFSLRCFKDSYTPPQTFHLVFKGDAIDIPALEVYEGMTAAVPPAPFRDGYEFKGWFTDEGYAQEFNFDEPFTKDRTAYAKWDITQEKLTELKDTAKAEIKALANLSPEEKTDFKNQVDIATDEAGIIQAVNAAKAKDAANLENKKTPAKSESGYSGGGGSSRIYSKTTATTTTINDTPLANNKAEQSVAPEELATLPSTITPSSSSTTASSISSTNKITRGQLAQLLVFLDNAGIPLKKPKTNSGCQFSDVAPHQRVATQAVCQRGLMGIDEKTKLPLAKFDPNQTLSYADFATVLSRMLFAYQYDGNGFYYQSHINALQELNILATTNPHEKISSHTVVSLLASLAKPSLGK